MLPLLHKANTATSKFNYASLLFKVPVMLRTIASKCHQVVASCGCHPACLLPTSHTDKTALGNEEVLQGP